MANKVMEAKALKLQRQLRALPKPLPGHHPQGRFNAPDGKPDKIRPIPARLSAAAVSSPMQPNGELMEGYQHRAKSLGLPDLPGRFTGVPPARKEVEEMIQRIKDQHDAYLSFTILDTRVHRARVYFNLPKTAFILIYEQHKTGEVLRSLPHCDKKELIDNFRRDNLVMVKHVSSG